jgi:hypothetical protein
MVRRFTVVAICTLVLTGCDRAPNDRMARELHAEIVSPNVPPPAIVVDSASPSQQQFSYTHSWTVTMGHGTVSPRFTRARDLCLHDRTLNCKLVSATMTSGGDDTAFVSATLEVQLPHGKLDVFERALLAPVKGESVGDAVVQSRSTQAQSVETEVGDNARKVAQLTAYRDRLADVAKRSNMSVEDIIKLEAERARVQTDLDEATGQQRTLTNGIAREDVSITLTERAPPVDRLATFARDAGVTLTESTVSAVLFAIGALPWLPLVALLIWLVSRLLRWLLQRRAIRVVVARNAGTASSASS